MFGRWIFVAFGGGSGKRRCLRFRGCGVGPRLVGEFGVLVVERPCLETGVGT